MKLAPMRMRTALMLVLLSVSVGFAALSLVAVHSILKSQIRAELAADLHRSVVTFRNFQGQRREMLRRQAALLADLPSLKALMTSRDSRTIEDGGGEFYEISGSSLFALEDANGRSVAVFVNNGLSADPALKAALDLPEGSSPVFRYVISGPQLYDIATAPLYFGAPDRGTLLGYVSIGYAIDETLSREVRESASAEVVFSADGRILSGTLGAVPQAALMAGYRDLLLRGEDQQDLWLGSEHYMASSVRLSGAAGPPVQIVALKSYDVASRYLDHLNQVLLALGAMVFLVGGFTAHAISKSITRPLESLATGVHALGSGNYEAQLEMRGAREVRELSTAFEGMRTRLQQTQQELLEAERFATIGRMASSISHDLRHYLSAVYANAEFLGNSEASAEDRAELLAEVRLGVEGMTDLIESLLFFSRTGQPLQITCESVAGLLDRAIALVRMHLEAEGVAITTAPMPAVDVWVDGRKMERALYNLLLNACQAAKAGQEAPAVSITLEDSAEWIKLLIADNGPGISSSVLLTLFQPFVSEGKQSGVGLGLTIASRIAEEHGGKVAVESSAPGRTVFSFSLAKRARNAPDRMHTRHVVSTAMEGVAPQR